MLLFTERLQFSNSQTPLSLFPLRIHLEMSSHTIAICEVFVRVRGSLLKESDSEFVAAVFYSVDFLTNTFVRNE